MNSETIKGVKRFGVAVIFFGLLAYGSWVYKNLYGVWISIILMLIALAIGTKELWYKQKQRVTVIKKPFM